MKKYIKLLIIPLSLMLVNCTGGSNKAADSQAGTDSTTIDSTSTDSTTATQDPIKADTPITNGQRSMPRDSN